MWDFIFGTAVEHEPRPTRFGIDGYQIPESLVQQFVSPFRYLRQSPASTSAAAAAPASTASAATTPADVSAAPHTVG